MIHILIKQKWAKNRPLCIGQKTIIMLSKAKAEG